MLNINKLPSVPSTNHTQVHHPLLFQNRSALPRPALSQKPTAAATSTAKTGLAQLLNTKSRAACEVTSRLRFQPRFFTANSMAAVTQCFSSRYGYALCRAKSKSLFLCRKIAVRSANTGRSRPLMTTNGTRAEAGSGDSTCVTYATADKYRMDSFVVDILKDSRFTLKTMPIEFRDAANIECQSEGVLADPSNPGAMFIFRNGVIAFWNMTPEIVESILNLSRRHAEDIYPVSLVKWESEEMPYMYEPGKTKFLEGKFVLNSEASRKNHILDMFAFSNALSSSVKLGHWEYTLDSIIASLEPIPVGLIKGQKLKYETNADVLRKIGEILLLRHRVNLQHNLLDIPDVYWEHEDLEKLYLQTARSLNISKRVHLMNEKLTYCAHMVELLKTDMHEKRSFRVELLIVLLISIEVVFEVLRLFVLPYFREEESDEE